MSSRKCIVICGGGTIGAAIAYFTSRRGARPILIERHEVAVLLRPPANRQVSWRSTGAAAPRSINWRGEALKSMPNFLPARQSLGISASDDLRRLRRRGPCRARSGRATVALRRSCHHELNSAQSS